MAGYFAAVERLKGPLEGEQTTAEAHFWVPSDEEVRLVAAALRIPEAQIPGP